MVEREQVFVGPILPGHGPARTAAPPRGHERSRAHDGSRGLDTARARDTTPGRDRGQPRGSGRAGNGVRAGGIAEPTGPLTWAEIAERYGDTIYTMAYRLTGNREEARDLAQDVFVRVYRNLDRYQPGTFEGWLYRITKNLFLDRVRRRARVWMEPLPDEEWRQPAESAPGPAEHVDAAVLRSDLEIALDELPIVFRTAVVLCDIQGLSYEEIADATGWPIGTVRSRIHRGRRTLRHAIDGGPNGHGGQDGNGRRHGDGAFDG